MFDTIKEKTILTSKVTQILFNTFEEILTVQFLESLTLHMSDERETFATFENSHHQGRFMVLKESNSSDCCETEVFVYNFSHFFMIIKSADKFDFTKLSLLRNA